MIADDFNLAGIELAPGVRVARSALRVQFSRSSGPGGQNVNKLNTKAEIWLDLNAVPINDRAMQRLLRLAGRKVTGAFELHVVCEASRSQEQNRAAAMQSIRDLLVQAMVEPKKRRKSKPSKGSKQRRLDQKKHRAQIKARRSSSVRDDH